MRCTPGDPCGIHAPAGNLLRAIVVALPRLVTWHRPRSPRLHLLTGTRPQQADIVLAVRPVVRELMPTLEAVGFEVSSISLLPTLAGPAGEPLQAEVEQANGSTSFAIRLAHWVGGTPRRGRGRAGGGAPRPLPRCRRGHDRAANADCHPGDGSRPRGGDQEGWPPEGGAPAARSGERRSRGDRRLLAPLARDFPDDQDVRKQLDILRWRLRQRHVAPAEAALRDVQRRPYRDDPEAAVTRLAQVEMDGLPDDLARPLFGLWSNACYGLVQRRGWHQPKRYAPFTSRGMVFARPTPEGPDTTVSALGMPEWRPGDMVTDQRALRASRPLDPR
jgi:hypothetical protein